MHSEGGRERTQMRQTGRGGAVMEKERERKKDRETGNESETKKDKK